MIAEVVEDGIEEAELLELGVDAYGVGLSIAVESSGLLERLGTVLPPYARRREPMAGDARFVVRRHGFTLMIEYPAGNMSGSADEEIALDVLESSIRAYIALHAPDRIFVHAGVVAHAGRAIVIPGPSFSGKTALVAELIRAGAEYYSDEYAVLDATGRVHPYPKPLSLRQQGLSQVDRDVEELGGTVGDGPARIGLVLATRYRPGATWAPQPLTEGDAVLAMLANTVPAMERPGESIAAIRRAVAGAVLLEAERDEARAIAHQLLTLASG